MRAPQYAPRADELFGPECIRDPQPLFARLRREAPISRVAETGVHLVATWDLIEEALGREADFSANLTGVLIRGADGAPAIFPIPETGASQVIATADEPRHGVHRALAQPRLAAGRIAAMEAAVRAWTLEALEPWLAAGGGDFVPIAEGVPARAVATLLGLPEGDVSRHRAWAMAGGDMLAGDVDMARVGQIAVQTAGMGEYLARHLEAAGQETTDPGPEAPLLQTFAAAVRRGDIDTSDAIGIGIVLFGAGGESTAALLGSVAHRLAAEPAWAEALRARPGDIPRFVEEVARLEPPFTFHYRVVRRACTLGGAELAPGDRLMLLWASANRDAAHLEEPDALRLDRRHPKQHLAFGRGAHFCIGAPLARLEARVLCEELLARTRSLAVSDPAGVAYARSIFVRRLERLPLEARTA